MRAIVSFASEHGSTAEVAAAVAAVLRDAGVDVVVLPVAELGDAAAGADALVLGSAVHNGRWLAAAERWAADGPHPSGPVWLFSVSSVGETSGAFGPRVSEVMRRRRRDPDAVQRLRASLDVRDHRNFAGVLQRGQWGRLGTLFMVLCGGRYGDHRDRRDITAWATAIAAALGRTAAPTAQPLGSHDR